MDVTKKESVEMELMEENEETVTKSRDSQVLPQVENLTGKFDKVRIHSSL